MCSKARFISDRQRAEAEKEGLEKQMHQAQKLESIGRLAGGVAHDLNNMLSPIIGYGELLMEDLKDDLQKHERLQQIVQAGYRAPRPGRAFAGIQPQADACLCKAESQPGPSSGLKSCCDEPFAKISN